MTLWLHIYRDSDGIPAPCDATESFDDAMQWLDDFHDGLQRAGYLYERTIAVQDADLAAVGYATHQHLLSGLDEWRRERDSDVRLETRAQVIELNALRMKQL